MAPPSSLGPNLLKKWPQSSKMMRLDLEYRLQNSMQHLWKTKMTNACAQCINPPFRPGHHHHHPLPREKTQILVFPQYSQKKMENKITTHNKQVNRQCPPTIAPERNNITFRVLIIARNNQNQNLNRKNHTYR
ncbi:hypothetical protein CICLE_v10017152mg [Citrus x clementina]|uniref:Uncharacterized protein n=1 Tax=Citrus clementina TaxID=85681 RepID=V4UIV4_CITCL|nr:hypothetical protein CICLE_v10017152mg [Citrus x clementina]